MKQFFYIFFIITYTIFLNGSDNDLFAAERQSPSSPSTPRSELINPEELAPPPQQPNLLLTSAINHQKYYKEAAQLKKTWKWRACQSLSQVLGYGVVTYILLQEPTDNFTRVITIVPAYFTSVISLILAYEIKHFRTSKNKMNQALRDAAIYYTDEQMEELKQLSSRYDNSLTRDFVDKIQNHRKLLK